MRHARRAWTEAPTRVPSQRRPSSAWWHSAFTLPILIAHGEDNDPYPFSEALSLYRAWRGEKALHRIRGAVHTE